jgi:hypothetical protein
MGSAELIALDAVAELHIPDHLADGAETTDQIARIEKFATVTLLPCVAPTGKTLSRIGLHTFGG